MIALRLRHRTTRWSTWSRGALRFLESLFAAGMESFREPRGIPLDLVVAGVVAVVPPSR